MRENVTVIFKSFERQKMAKRLYENLQKYYPGVRVVIADDSRKPLDLQGDSLTIIQLPFNSGLSYGLNQALERVDTPYVMRMDDDELLTVRTRLGKQVEFLERYSEIDIVGFCVLTAIRCQNPDEAVSEFTRFSMKDAPKPLLIPHMTRVDGNHFVIPFKGGLYGGDQGWFPPYVHGLYRTGRIRLFVTSGLSSEKQMLPRWNNRPEIAVLKVYGSDGESSKKMDRKTEN